jgi:hypothetical protein
MPTVAVIVTERAYLHIYSAIISYAITTANPAIKETKAAKISH